ncbi:GAF domain-containing protein [Salipiger mucosus]|uniref:Putative signal transduction histidine kinase with GAF domain protein n=1 Tax=Salipiger mucosus DSM 16094 TaxID=1123237 RepID=S9RWG3_9RHOB|nr:GAF domain-containing protein [Salipiger mucosus]EPX78354.1 putative signal transduction histidine kinase with GAF domain protein [Salipiger mucosus DSM 16094]
MALAPKPEDEADRLAELESFGALDSAPEPSLDEIVRLLASMLDVPVALISLVGSDRQWFKARHGFTPTETPLDQSICSHALLDGNFLEIPDTAQDPRTADNPLCCGIRAEMRFYAGAPLITRAGHVIGTVCVLDERPRRLTDQQRQLLEVMARQVMQQLDLHRALALKEELRSEIDHRVKNSLQTVASTIRLYRARTKSPETLDALDAVGRRVDAISQLHAELNMASKMHHVRLDAYLARVATLLQRQAPVGMSLIVDVPALEVESRVAAALGVIASEFAANATKYGYPDGAEGAQLRFTASRGPDGALSFRCGDNGTGQPGTIDPLSSTALGSRLMEAAAQQVGGTITQGRDVAGFVLTVDLPGPGGLSSPDVARKDAHATG